MHLGPHRGPSEHADPRRAFSAIRFCNILVVSAASAWDIAIKFRAGKLPSAESLVADFAAQIEREGFQLLDISPEHAIRAGLLPGPHRDPIITNKVAFESYGVRRLW